MKKDAQYDADYARCHAAIWAAIKTVNETKPQARALMAAAMASAAFLAAHSVKSSEATIRVVFRKMLHEARTHLAKSLNEDLRKAEAHIKELEAQLANTNSKTETT